MPPDVRDLLQPFVDRGEIAGLVALAWRDGALIDETVLGAADLAAGTPMRRDTLFRIASMTKPLTSVAALALVEDGRLRLDTPVAEWVPELAAPAVLRTPASALADVVPARRAITVEDLLTHRSGIGYAFTSPPPIAAAYRTLGPAFYRSVEPAGWLAGLGRLPLVYQPGERMFYGQSTDVLGLLVGRVAGRSFGDVLRERVLAPLGMTDTAFHVPAAKRDRLAALYGVDPASDALVPEDVPVPATQPAFCQGGVGLVSTADDYLRFARMLLGSGELDGARLLAPATVAAMLTDRLTAEQRRLPFIANPTWDGMGFGLGVAVVDRPDRNLLGCGGAGSFTWPGAYGTWWQVDPAERLAMVYMVQHAVPLTPASGDAIAAGRGLAGRGALTVWQRAIYERLGLPATGTLARPAESRAA